MRWLTHNIGWKILSLLAATVVWWNIANDPDLAAFISAPVQFRNYPNDLEISSPVVDTIDVETRGPAGQLRDLRSAHLSAVIDFSTVKTPGERTFTLTSKEVQLPKGVELVRTVPAQLRFTFERRATRELKVDVPTSGVLQQGLALSSIEVYPPTLTITGPESRVRAASNAVTDSIDLRQITGDSERPLSVFVSEREVRFVNAPQVTVKIHIKRTRL
jgi:YbbR domain-containing protein